MCHSQTSPLPRAPSQVAIPTVWEARSQRRERCDQRWPCLCFVGSHWTRKCASRDSLIWGLKRLKFFILKTENNLPHTPVPPFQPEYRPLFAKYEALVKSEGHLGDDENQLENRLSSMHYECLTGGGSYSAGQRPSPAFSCWTPSVHGSSELPMDGWSQWGRREKRKGKKHNVDLPFPIVELWWEPVCLPSTTSNHTHTHTHTHTHAHSAPWPCGPCLESESPPASGSAELVTKSSEYITQQGAQEI